MVENVLRISTPKQLADLLQLAEHFSSTLDFPTVCINPLPIRFRLDGSGRVRGICPYHGKQLSNYIGKDGCARCKELKTK